MYEFLAQLAQTWGLILFVVAFLLVLFFALNPKHQADFDAASKLPLDDEETPR